MGNAVGTFQRGSWSSGWRVFAVALFGAWLLSWGSTHGQSRDDFVDEWVNVNPLTDGIPHITIGPSGDGLSVHAYGACSPTWCDWGAIESAFSGNPLTVVYEFWFVTTTMHLCLCDEDYLFVHTDDVFHDGTQRDYVADYLFRRSGKPADLQATPEDFLGTWVSIYPENKETEGLPTLRLLQLEVEGDASGLTFRAKGVCQPEDCALDWISTPVPFTGNPLTVHFDYGLGDQAFELQLLDGKFIQANGGRRGESVLARRDSASVCGQGTQGFSSLRCELTPEAEVAITWLTLDPSFDSVRILQDGSAIAEVSPSAGGYRAPDPGPGAHDFKVLGLEAGDIRGEASCQVYAPYFIDLVCRAPEPNQATISWRNGGQYDGIVLRRDGEIVATLAAGAEEYLDAMVQPGRHRYCLTPLVAGVERNGRECCDAVVRAIPIDGLSCAFIHAFDTAGAQEFKTLLESQGIATDLYRAEDAALVDLSSYGVIVVGSDTGDLGSWDSSDAVPRIDGAGPPILGLGEGGYSFFGRLGLAIGYGHGWHGGDTGIHVVDPLHPVFQEPNPISPGADPFLLELYVGTGHVGIYLPQIAQDVHVLGREVWDGNHYPLVMEKERYLLWGFTGAPASMTEEGKLLFVNCVHFLAGVTGFAVFGTPFVRGDVDASGDQSLTDPIVLLNHLFLGAEEPPCLDAADTDDSGRLNITDAVYSLNHQFFGGPEPEPPFGECGIDPTVDGLDCGQFPHCR